jgi:hypothetical protein
MADIDWTEARDARLRRLRSEGWHWPEIGAELGVTADVARERGRRIGAPFPGLAPRPPREDPARQPLPPGHPRAWALLTDGTLLAGSGWPGLA